MVTVEVRLFATLRKYRPGGPSGEPVAFQVAEDTTVAQLLRQLAVPARETQQIFVNGRQSPLSYALRNGDRVGIFPPIAGGGAER